MRGTARGCPQTEDGQVQEDGRWKIEMEMDLGWMDGWMGGRRMIDT